MKKRKNLDEKGLHVHKFTRIEDDVGGYFPV
jgi:hypothetical protein